MLGEDEKMNWEKIVETFSTATEQIEERLIPGSGETDCSWCSVCTNFQLLILFAFVNIHAAFIHETRKRFNPLTAGADYIRVLHFY